MSMTLELDWKVLVLKGNDELREAIAERGEDGIPPLVLAGWLEEGG
jgi:hypothetical protein